MERKPGFRQREFCRTTAQAVQATCFARLRIECSFRDAKNNRPAIPNKEAEPGSGTMSVVANCGSNITPKRCELPIVSGIHMGKGAALGGRFLYISGGYSTFAPPAENVLGIGLSEAGCGSLAAASTWSR